MQQTNCSSDGVKYSVHLYFHSVIISVGILIAIFTITFNAIYLFSMVKHSHSLLSADVPYIMLSISDLLSGCVYMPIWCLSWTLFLLLKSPCALWTFVGACGHVLASMSATTIAVISLDLYVSILHPFFHQTHSSKRRSFFVIIFCWLFTAFITIVFTTYLLDFWHVYEYLSGSFVVFIVFCLSLLHLKIFLEIRRIRSRLKDNTVERRKIIKAQRKAFKMGIKVFAVFCLCYVPISWCLIYGTLVDTSTVLISCVEQVAILVLYSNPMLDPFIYYFRLSRIRTKVFQSFGKKKRIGATSSCCNLQSFTARRNTYK